MRGSIWLRYAGAFATLLFATTVRASELRVYPVAGLYGLEQTDCNPSSDPATVQTAKIAKVFCPQLTADHRQAIGRNFRERVAAAFPGTISSLSEQVGAGETPEASLSKTAIASLQISRADLWLVDKGPVYDVYVPITVSLFLTNALSGEVLFVQNYSTIVEGTLSKDHYLDQAPREMASHLDDAISALVTKAAARFKPYALSGTVRGKLADGYVFDLGRKGGVREGDTIGADAKAVFSDANYSVIEPILGGLTVGQGLSRQVAQPVDVLAKPSALVVVAAYPEGMSRGYINAEFEDALGEDAALAIAPVNPSFAKLRTLIIGEAKVASAYENTRVTPDYFVRLSVEVLKPLDLPSNLTYARRQVFEADAFVEVVDHAGRVIFATRGSNRIVDEVLHGVSFSPEQRQDTVVKNALGAAAAALSKGFHPAKLRLEAQPAGDDVQIADAGGALALGAKAALLRRFGSVPGVAGDVWAPVGNLEVVSFDPGGAHARFGDVEPRRARAGDQIAYDSGTGPIAQSRRQFAPCEGPNGSPSVSQRGAITEPLFGEIALNSFVGAFQAPVRLAHFDAELGPFLGQFADARQLGAMHPRPVDICFEAVSQIDPAGEKAAASGQVSPIYHTGVGYALLRDGQKVAGAGLQQTLTATSLPVQSDPATRDASLQYDLVKPVAELATQVAHGLRPPE
jgi:hypothetical protein